MNKPNKNTTILVIVSLILINIVISNLISPLSGRKNIDSNMTLKDKVFKVVNHHGSGSKEFIIQQLPKEHPTGVKEALAQLVTEGTINHNRSSLSEDGKMIDFYFIPDPQDLPEDFDPTNQLEYKTSALGKFHLE